MPTATETQVDIDQLRAHEQVLENAKKIVKNALKGHGDKDISELQTAVQDLYTELGKGDESLFELLKEAEVALERDHIKKLIELATKPEIVKFLRNTRNKLRNVFKGVRSKIEDFDAELSAQLGDAKAEEKPPEPTVKEPVEPPEPTEVPAPEPVPPEPTEPTAPEPVPPEPATGEVMLTGIGIFGGSFDIPSDDPDKMLKVLASITKRFDALKKASEDDLTNLKMLEGYLKEYYPDNPFIESAIDELVRQAEKAMQKKAPPPKPKEKKKKKKAPEPAPAGPETKGRFDLDKAYEVVKDSDEFKKLVGIVQIFKQSFAKQYLPTARARSRFYDKQIKHLGDKRDVVRKTAGDLVRGSELAFLLKGTFPEDKEVLQRLLNSKNVEANADAVRNAIAETVKELEGMIEQAKQQIDQAKKKPPEPKPKPKLEPVPPPAEPVKKADEIINRHLELLLGKHPVLREIVIGFISEEPERLDPFLTAWRIYKGESYDGLDEDNRRKITNLVSDLVETSKVDSEDNRTVIREDLRHLLTRYGDMLRNIRLKTPPSPPEGAGPPPISGEIITPSGGEPDAGTARMEARETTEAVSEDVESQIRALMAEVLSDKNLYDPKKDPASLAIYKLVRTLETDKLAGLKGFLLKPKLTLTPTIDKDIKKGITELRSELKKKEQEEKRVNREINGIDKLLGGRGTIKKEDADVLLAKQLDLQKQLDAIENRKNEINMAIGYKNGTMRYRSTTQLLGMINYYIVSEIYKKRPSEADIVERVEKQIEKQRTDIHGRAGKLVNLAFGILSGFTMLKPGLKATLTHLVKDESLSKIGEEKLAKLAKCWSDVGAVKAWVNNLEGAEEQNVTKTVPRIIAYLEMALRDGNMRYLRVTSARKARELVKHLKAVRHEFILNKIEKTLSNDAEDVDRMNAYFRELNMATTKQDEITKKLISRRAVVRTLAGVGIAGTAGVAGAGLAVGALAAKIGIAGGAMAGGAAIAGRRAEKPEHKKSMYRVAGRAVGATALAVGATFLSGGVLAPALAAIPGLFSPEIIKYRKQIAEKGVAAGREVVPRAGRLAKFALLTGLTGGLYLAYKAKQRFASGPTLQSQAA